MLSRVEFKEKDDFDFDFEDDNLSAEDEEYEEEDFSDDFDFSFEAEELGVNDCFSACSGGQNLKFASSPLEDTDFFGGDLFGSVSFWGTHHLFSPLFSHYSIKSLKDVVVGNKCTLSDVYHQFLRDIVSSGNGKVNITFEHICGGSYKENRNAFISFIGLLIDYSYTVFNITSVGVYELVLNSSELKIELILFFDPCDFSLTKVVMKENS